ncbi:hypothetical protein Tco_1400209 [Tanacetum coccineum]
MVNIFPPDHVNDLPVIEPNQPDLAPAIPGPALVDENEEPEEEEEFEEEEPQEEGEDMEVDIGEEENKPELTFPYEEADPLNPPPHGESSTATFLREDGDSLLPSFIRRDINSLFGRIYSLSKRVCIRDTAHALVKNKGKEKDKYYGKLILDLGNEVRSSVEERVTALEDPVREFCNAEERLECKKLKRELEEAGLSNTLLRMQNERVERDLYWTRVFFCVVTKPCHQKRDQAAIERMITSRINEALTIDQARRVNASGARDLVKVKHLPPVNALSLGL